MIYGITKCRVTLFVLKHWAWPKRIQKYVGPKEARVWGLKLGIFYIKISNSGRGFRIVQDLENEGKSAASFCCQVAALVPDMFCNFYLAKFTKLLITQQWLKLEEKIRTYLESIEFWKFFDVCLTLLNKISHRFLVTTKLFSGWKSLNNG